MIEKQLETMTREELIEELEASRRIIDHCAEVHDTLHAKLHIDRFYRRLFPRRGDAFMAQFGAP